MHRVYGVCVTLVLMYTCCVSNATGPNQQVTDIVTCGAAKIRSQTVPIQCLRVESSSCDPPVAGVRAKDVPGKPEGVYLVKTQYCYWTNVTAYWTVPLDGSFVHVEGFLVSHFSQKWNHHSCVNLAIQNVTALWEVTYPVNVTFYYTAVMSSTGGKTVSVTSLPQAPQTYPTAAVSRDVRHRYHFQCTSDEDGMPWLKSIHVTQLDSPSSLSARSSLSTSLPSCQATLSFTVHTPGHQVLMYQIYMENITAPRAKMRLIDTINATSTSGENIQVSLPKDGKYRYWVAPCASVNCQPSSLCFCGAKTHVMETSDCGTADTTSPARPVRTVVFIVVVVLVLLLVICAVVVKMRARKKRYPSSETCNYISPEVSYGDEETVKNAFMELNKRDETQDKNLLS